MTTTARSDLEVVAIDTLSLGDRSHLVREGRSRLSLTRSGTSVWCWP